MVFVRVTVRQYDFFLGEVSELCDPAIPAGFPSQKTLPFLFRLSCFRYTLFVGRNNCFHENPASGICW